MTSDRLNVLFITADQWRGECLGAVRHPVVNTPNLDRLARRGTLFRRHFANCAPCGPSRASLLTGTYLHRHRSCINGTPLDARFTNIALEARKLGYRPTVFGYTDTSVDPRTLPAGDPRLTTYEGFMAGFDIGLDMTEGYLPWLAWLQERGHSVPSEGIRIYMPDDYRPAYWKFGNPHALPPFSAEESETSFQTARTIDWLQAHGGEPWFLHLSYLRPHPPFVAPPPYHNMYNPDRVGAPLRRPARSDEGRLHPFLAWALERAAWRAPDRAEDLLKFKAIYFALMTQFDDSLGRLLAWLEEHDQLPRTLIVFTSDHGEMMGDHWLMGKLGFFDQAFHIPLIVCDPRVGGGNIVDDFTESVDIMPTILDLLGASVPLQVQGRSLRPFLFGGRPANWRTEAHWEFDFRDPESRAAEMALNLKQDQCTMAVQRGTRFKYVQFAALPPLLFDLENDPGEFNDLAASGQHASVALSCAQAMLRWRMLHEERQLTGYKLTAPVPVDVREEPY